jgi:hypothetical protein
MRVRATMTRWKWVLLIFELALFALILILPQVDLPDFAFQGGTAPITAKARVISAPVQPVVASIVFSAPEIVLEQRTELPNIAAPITSQTRLSMICTLLC